jgi:adenylate kinase family enzyme
MRPTKIHIIGSVGSGKSTLARSLSEKLQIPYYELDNVVWRRTENGDIRNSPEVRDSTLQKIVHSDAWIIEGVHYEWVGLGFEQADLIIYLDTPIYKRNYRILKRYVVQRLGFEKGNYQQSLKMLKKMYGWNYNFEKNERPSILNRLAPYKNKLIFLKDNTDYEKVIK